MPARRLLTLLLLASPALAQPVTVIAKRAATSKGAHCSNPKPSPDGAWVAYEVEVSPKIRAQRLLSVASGENRKVAPKLSGAAMMNRLRKNRGGKRSSVCHELAWGNASAQPFVLSCDDGGGRYRLYHASHVGEVPQQLGNSAANDLLPDLMRDRAVFVSDRSGNGDLYLTNLSDGATSALGATTEDAEIAPTAAPDGSGVAYVRHGISGGDDLYYIATHGGSAVQLTHSSATEFQPRFSPDGRQLAYLVASSKDAPVELHVAAISGSGLSGARLVMKGVVAGDRNGFGWTPDSKGLVYARHEDPVNPLEIAWLNDMANPVRLNTGTLQNSTPSLTATADGWLLAWTAQAKVADTEKRWTQIFTAITQPAQLGSK